MEMQLVVLLYLTSPLLWSKITFDHIPKKIKVYIRV